MHGCDPAKTVAKDKTSQANSAKLTDCQSMSELWNSTTLQRGRENPAWQVGIWQLTRGIETCTVPGQKGEKAQTADKITRCTVQPSVTSTDQQH